MHTYAHTHVRTHIHIHIETHIYAWTHIHIPIYVHTHIHTHAYAHTYIYAQACTHIYTCIYTHMHIHTQMGGLKKYQRSQYNTEEMNNIWRTNAECGEGANREGFLKFLGLERRREVSHRG